MKKIILAILVLAVLGLSLTGCQTGLGGYGWNPVGTWRLVSSTYSGDSLSLGHRYIIKSNGSWEEIISENLESSGTYEYDDEEIRLNATWSKSGTGMGIRRMNYDAATNELAQQLSNYTRRFAKQ